VDFLTKHGIASVPSRESLVSENHISLIRVTGHLLYVSHFTDLTETGYSASPLNSNEKLRVCENWCSRRYILLKDIIDVVSRFSKFNVRFG